MTAEFCHPCRRRLLTSSIAGPAIRIARSGRRCWLRQGAASAMLSVRLPEMWQSRCETLTDGRVQRYTLFAGDAAVSYSDVLALWKTNAEFRSFFTTLLTESSFTAFRWETPPVTSTTLDRAFEFVLLRSNALDRPVDRSAFCSHFNVQDVVTFPNLGGDAVMVVPCPVGPDSIYGHLASFLRNAPESQIHQLWDSVGKAMQKRIGDRPVWLSTAGMGVAWLHVRLDSRPKYYGHGPYKVA